MRNLMEDIEREEFFRLFKKLKKKPCYFCGDKNNIIITLIKIKDRKRLEEITAPICHVCFNQAIRLDGLEFEGKKLHINPN